MRHVDLNLATRIIYYYGSYGCSIRIPVLPVLVVLLVVVLVVHVVQCSLVQRAPVWRRWVYAVYPDTARRSRTAKYSGRGYTKILGFADGTYR